MPENTQTKAVPVLESPAQVAAPAPAPLVCTLDKAVDLLPVGVLKNAMMWDYAKLGDTDAATLTEAIGELQIQGNARHELTGAALINRFWDLHNDYAAPNCSEVRAIYEDILEHVVSLQDKFGDVFLRNDSRSMEELVERLSGECGAPDEEEKNRTEMLPVLVGRSGNVTNLRKVVKKWVTQLGNLPDREGVYKDRVNMDMIAYYFREDGVLGYCVKLISDFLQRARDKDFQQDVIDYDLANQIRYQREGSCILLGSRCNMTPQPVTKLHADWYADRRVQALIKNRTEANQVVRDAVTALFVYSDVDSALTRLVDRQKQAMNGKDKNEHSYDDVREAHLDDGVPPWRTANGGWPEDSVMENTNYRMVEALLEDAVEAVAPRAPRGSKRFREPAEEGEKKPEKPPTSKKQKVAEAPPQEVQVKVEEVEADQTNYALWGGIAAVGAGITAIALSRRSVRSR